MLEGEERLIKEVAQPSLRVLPVDHLWGNLLAGGMVAHKDGASTLLGGGLGRQGEERGWTGEQQRGFVNATTAIWACSESTNLCPLISRTNKLLG